MKKNTKKPFFAKFLENQIKDEKLKQTKGGTVPFSTDKYPSDTDEDVTHKWPSDDDEDGPYA